MNKVTTKVFELIDRFVHQELNDNEMIDGLYEIIEVVDDEKKLEVEASKERCLLLLDRAKCNLKKIEHMTRLINHEK
jgi:hypothetical protein